MRVADWVSLFGLVSGPLLAVVITLWAERRRGRNERRATIVRSILLTRRQPADYGFHGSINSIPLEYAGEAQVMTAWEDYLAVVGRPSPPENDGPGMTRALADWNSQLDVLLLRMLEVQGHKERAAKGIIRANYDPIAAGAMRDMQVRALQGIPRLADAVERSAAASELMLGRLGAAQAAPTDTGREEAG